MQRFPCWRGLVVVSSCALTAPAVAGLSGNATRVLSDQKADFLTLGASGDFMPNADMMRLAFPRHDGYQSYFLGGLAGLMHAPDVFMCNHETAAGECVNDDWQDVGKPCEMKVGSVYNFQDWRINSHPRLEADFVAMGVDVVSLANNHIMDRGPLGLARTINALNDVGLPFTGARKQSDPIPWEVYTDKKGWRIAWIGCCEHLTDSRASGSDQVLYCNDKDLPGLITQLSDESTVDAVIIALHWGRQTKVDVYQTKVTDKMRDLARSFIDAGASAIVGAHPHVLMEKEFYTPSGTDRQGLILYSLGNFVAIQAYSENSLGRCMDLEDISRKQCKRILKSKVAAYFKLEPHDSGKASVSRFRYVVITWDDKDGGMVPDLEDVAKKSWAAEALGEEYRLPGRSSKYYNVKADRFCSNSQGRKNLPDVKSVQQCRDQALAHKDCGIRFTSNGKQCRCTPLGEECKTASSSAGNNLYKLKEVLPGEWERVKADHYCGSSGRKNLPDVTSVQECQDLAQDDPDCGSELATNGNQCRCMRYGKRCDAKPSSGGNAVYKWVESTEGLWFLVRKNMYCADTSDRKTLADVSSQAACQVLVDADADCGDTFISNGKQCRCMRKGKECSFRESSSGNVVYMWLTAAAEQWRGIQGSEVTQADVYSVVEMEMWEGTLRSGQTLPPVPHRLSSWAIGLFSMLALQVLVAVALRRRWWLLVVPRAPATVQDEANNELLAG